jgi:hypothetical protein
MECHLYVFSPRLGDGDDTLLLCEVEFFPSSTWRGGQVNLESFQEGHVTPHSKWYGIVRFGPNLYGFIIGFSPKRSHTI